MPRPAATASRHGRAAAVIEFVGRKAEAEGRTPTEVASRCVEALRAHADGRLTVTLDPETRAVVAVDT